MKHQQESINQKLHTTLWSTILVLCTFTASAADRPNILWITSEDNGISWVGCYGGRNARTPNIDQLAADGFRYTAALQGSRLRMSTGLPALLGGRTLDQLEGASWSDLEKRVKVSRQAVKVALFGSYVRSVPWLPGSWMGEYRRACQKAAT